MNRGIKKTVRGQRTVDGAGVHLVRVLGYDDVEDFDPFLMLDSFDSVNPSDYLAGFPMHPHRGIETVTYLISGRIDHEDSMGNKDTIHAGECQWMTAGNGVLHQEMPKESDRMLGLQLWLNLPGTEKMAEPNYLAITRDKIKWTKKDDARIGVLSGCFEGVWGVKPKHIQASIYDVILPKGGTVSIPAPETENVFVFLIEGDAVIEDDRILSKSAVLFGEGDTVKVTAPKEADLRFLFFSGKSLHEPVAWGGPIVMNTQAELSLAFAQLRDGTFIRYK